MTKFTFNPNNNIIATIILKDKAGYFTRLVAKDQKPKKRQADRN